MSADRRFDAADRQRETSSLLRRTAILLAVLAAVAWRFDWIDRLGFRAGSISGGYDGSILEENGAGLGILPLGTGDEILVRYSVEAGSGTVRVSLHDYTRYLRRGADPEWRALRGDASGEFTMHARRWGLYGIHIRPSCPATPACRIRYSVEWSRR